MKHTLRRRDFLVATLAGPLLARGVSGFAATPATTSLISPGCRRTKVRVAKVYLGIPKAHWPTPGLELKAEMERYESEFDVRCTELADVDFPVTRLLTSKAEAEQAAAEMAGVDGILAIHLSMGVLDMVKTLLATGKPMVLFAAPYSGHEWTAFGALEKSPEGAQLDCVLSSDLDELIAAIRPFRAMHHLREAKIINVSARDRAPEFVAALKAKFGTGYVRIDRDRVLAAYDAVEPEAAKAEADAWIRGARAVMEPSTDEIERSCRLALAFEKLLDEEDATVITVDCYGTMYRQLPAFPCIGFTRLNDKGLGGICESDLSCAATHVLFQGLSGKPGFISDPTVDESADSIILAHCLGSTKMQGPDGPACPYKLRSIMERQEGAVPQVMMDVGERVTQARFVDPDQLVYFTGKIMDAPDLPRGCRTKIAVKVDGDIEALWQNWKHGLHRVTCYGDISRDLRRFCKFTNVNVIDEAAGHTV